MITVLQCQRCKSGYKYYGPVLKGNPLIECEKCGRTVRANVFVMLHKDDAIFTPLERPVDWPVKAPQEPEDDDLPVKKQADVLGVRECQARLFRPIPTLNALQEAKLWRNVKKKGPDDCWPWLGFRHDNGHGRMYVDGKAYIVTRLLWRLVHNTDPGQRQVLQTCHKPICCNPRHLFLG